TCFVCCRRIFRDRDEPPKLASPFIGVGNSGEAMDEIIYSSATELARAIREREVSSEEVVSAHLARIEELNPKINAVVQLTADAARARAREADAALARGENWGPLHGVPVTIKDAFEMAGIVSAG